VNGDKIQWEIIIAEFLTGFWRDLFTVFSVVGFLLTAIGVWLALKQMRRTTTAAEAAIVALNESKERYNRYVIAQSFRLLTETRVYVKNERWDTAAMRLGDVAELLIQVAETDPIWADFANRLHSIEKSFEKLERKESSISDSLRGKWHKLERELRTKIAENFGPFPDENVVSDDITGSIQTDS